MKLLADDEEIQYMKDVNVIIERLRHSNWFSTKDEKDYLAVCLPALIYALRIPVNVKKLCEQFPYKKEGRLSFERFEDVLSNLGYATIEFQMQLKDIDPRVLPVLLWINEGGNATPVIGIEIRDAHSKKEVEILCFDPESETYLSKKFSPKQNFNGCFFYSLDKDNHSGSAQWFKNTVKQFLPLGLDVVILSTFVSLMSLAGPIFILLIYGFVLSKDSIADMWPFLIGVVTATIFEFYLRRKRSSVLAWFGARLEYIASCSIFEKLLFMPSSFIEKAGVTSQIARIKSFDKIRDFFIGPLFMSMIEIPFSLITLTAIFFIAPSLVAIPITSIVIFISLSAIANKWITPSIKLAGITNRYKQELTLETFQNIKAINTNGIHNKWLERYRELSSKSSMGNFDTNIKISFIESITNAVYVLTGMTIIFFGVHDIWEGELSAGALVAGMILGWRAITPFQIFCNSVSKFEQVTNAINQVDRLMSVIDENKVTTKARVVGIEGNIEFIKVSFKYNRNSDPVIYGLNLKINKGDLVAITGNNGTGKSTIIKLITGLYQPQVGSIKIDGVDMRQLDQLELRKRVSYVSQEPHLFSGTIADNMRLADPLADDQTLLSTLKQAGVDNDVMSLPNGIHTEINSETVSLSESVIYRLNVARAYLKNSTILLIDELPFSFLNSEAGLLFKKNILAWKGIKTIVLVSHRDDFINLANKVVYTQHNNPPSITHANGRHSTQSI